ncbi:MAG: ATP-dependent helicase HrpA [Lentisphaeria bacterium]|jgi:ATP-dependent helicase HrpA
MSEQLEAYKEQIEDISLLDAKRMRQRLNDLIKQRDSGKPFNKKLEVFIADISRAKASVSARKLSIPDVTFPQDLPITASRDKITELIENNQVVVLAGETGSGKTTQIPKLCLTLGRGVKGLIGHTQPRRIAARTVASRIATELGVELGGTVGYQVRFADHTQANTAIKIMTDGILLAEIQRDPLLLKYDTLIIDEAHERSLNIDFLLGYLKSILPKRKDLKLIITSATIDLKRFSEHFNNAPIIEVSGRTYPVDVMYRPWQDEYEDQAEAIVAAIQEILNLSKGEGGDILVFMSGERDIREASHAIKKSAIPHLGVLPLYARLSLEEQNKIFQSHRGRKVVLTTNVAETSITVPGVKYVIDTGVARISRYSLRTKVQRLPIEAISQASANQRKGRCGRVSHGVCFRLYSEEDFNLRPQFTDAEIVRTNLAAVILQMLHMRIGDIRKFPFVDPPDNRLINDGYKLLEELSATTPAGKVTSVGLKLQSFPLDPKLARVVVEANKHNCIQEVLVIVAALSIQDPRERPADRKQAADEKHRRMWDEKSDLIAYLNLWNYIEEQRQQLSQNQFRKLCKQEYLNFLRIREWRDLHYQLKLSIKKLGFCENKNPASYDAIHRAFVCGFLSNIGHKIMEKDSREYWGTRNRKFSIFPGSSQIKKQPKWLMASEFIETSKLYSHNIAQIDPQWILESSEHLTKKHYFEPHYDTRSGQVKAYVKITLFGLVLVEKKRVDFNKVNQAEANDVFVREALVEGAYRGKGDFFAHNKRMIDEVHELEAKVRRRDIMVDEQVIFEFYKALVPGHISNLTGFEHWRKQEEVEHPRLLYLEKYLLMLHSAENASESQFPNQLRLGDYTFPVSYSFEPGKINDGVSISVPVELLHEIPEYSLDWLVPGLFREKCIALVKSLPKQFRKNFVPVPQYVDRVLPRLKFANIRLTEALSAALSHIGNCVVDAESWNKNAFDDYYRMNIQIIDDDGKIIDQGRDLSRLKTIYKEQVKKTLSDVGNQIEKSDLREWSFGELPESLELDKGAFKIKAYPALIEASTGVNLRLLDNLYDAKSKNRRGVAKLASLKCLQTTKYLTKNLLKGKDLGLTVVNLGRREQVIDDLVLAAYRQAMFSSDESVRTLQHFNRCVEQHRASIVDAAETYEAILLDCLIALVGIKKTIKSSRNALAITFAASDINAQLSRMFYPGCIFTTPYDWFKQFPRYLAAISMRLEKFAANPHKDNASINSLNEMWSLHEARFQKEGESMYELNPRWQEFRWMIEELRISLFAQSLKTRMPVSEKRLKAQWQSSLL